MNDDDNSGFSSIDLGFDSNNTTSDNNINNSIDSTPGINGGFTSEDLNNNTNVNTLSYDFSNSMSNTMSNSNNGTFLNNGADVNSNISNDSNNSLINVIADEPVNNSIFNKPKEKKDFFNVPPDLEGGFNSTPQDDLDGDFIVPPNFSSNSIQMPVQNNVQQQPIQNNLPNQNVQPSPAPSPTINLIDKYQDDNEDDGLLSKLFSKKSSQNINSGPSFNIKNRILRDKNIFKDIEVFKSFFKVVVDVIVFVVVAILLYRLYVKENSNVVKKLSKDANQYYKVCTIDTSHNETINMSGAFGIYEYDGAIYLEEVVLWSSKNGMIKIPNDRTEGDVVNDFAGLADIKFSIGSGEILEVNNYYKKPGMVFTSQMQSFSYSQYAGPDALVKKFIDNGANCR